ncbi:hypothetical protein Bphy_6828 (plasmid) [Paraburkholderia phymatum STM815]|uniref:MmgE/PrpD family protein n=1 Tax=Paraburkholderia phymatum (strain DSM 17167 / CIP 108236 / LMG 21445 / STM815) TaxID=391038 RepID=B2JTE2_PARP8|nr:hypothetical protein Bphy_6828 [Paraburkholderia phymatum STM815]
MIAQLARKIRYIADPAFDTRDGYGGKLVIALRDGTFIERTEPYHWGSPELPISAHDIYDKFEANTAASHLVGNVGKIISMIAALEDVGRVGDIVELCRREQD